MEAGTIGMLIVIGVLVAVTIWVLRLNMKNDKELTSPVTERIVNSKVTKSPENFRGGDMKKKE